MNGEVHLEVDFASDWELYSQAWKRSMNDFYWYKLDPIFDFNKNEELDEMRFDFDKPGNLFIVASNSGSNEIVGVLGLRYRDVVARIRRWEPAVISEFRNEKVTEILLDKAIEYLESMGVKRIGYLLKYPIDSPELVEKLLTQYQSAGFEPSRPDSVDLVMSLESFNPHIEDPIDLEIETGEGYTFEDLASITVKSFTSTPEEREIHGFDKTVTEHIQATALLQRMAEGFYGHSPNEFRKIAVVNGVPAGFLGAFVSKSKFKPLTGVLGPLAVLPDFRRRGVALHLVYKLLQTLKQYGCEYAAVGTPAANTGAIKLYEKAGFEISCRVVNLEMML
ncbi:MAG: GNAT family N-acetyltransferase [Candidatus Thorarchaeota archaeon]